jgi:2-oxoisovalerate dehydrogenase E1 component alpha subunit
VNKNGELPVIARFEVRRRAYLAPDGTGLGKLPGFASDIEFLVSLLRGMTLLRVFDLKAVALQRTGRLGTYPVSLGQEAASVGVASAMREEDVLLPSYRETGALIWRGVRMEDILAFWGGDERGSSSSGPAHDFPISIPVASQAPHAAGVAYAFKLRREPRVALCLCGDGATSKGDLWEAMNFAGVWKLPVVFVVTNNQWAISVPLKQQTASETLAQKAIAAGFAGEQVDGNDILAVHEAAAQAMEHARAGHGPRLIEAVTYRLGDHTTADDASRYRPAEEAQAHWKGEPIARLKAYLVRKGAWDKEREERLATECQERVEAAAAHYLAMDTRPPESIFDHLYAELPHVYVAQRDELRGAHDA